MSLPIATGDVIAGKYRVDHVLGKGGMGVVVAATHMQLQQRFAIKLLLEGGGGEVLERFQREARAASRLKSDHVARVSDVGALEDGSPYMVMEYLEGNDLSKVVRQRGPLPIAEVADYVVQACDAVAEAHAAGIIHRDLKPANLFLTTTASGAARIKVLDFGISRDSGRLPGSDEEMSLTQTTAVLGSPVYMSPEQMRAARHADARSDIWSLGVILYELSTRRLPFKAPTVFELMYLLGSADPAPPSTLREGMPPEFEAVILRCLQKNPDHRFQNVAELSAALAPFAAAEQREPGERMAHVLGVPMPRRSSIPPPSSALPPYPALDSTLPAPPTMPRGMYAMNGPVEAASKIVTSPSLGAAAPAAVSHRVAIALVSAALAIGTAVAVVFALLRAAGPGAPAEAEMPAAQAPAPVSNAVVVEPREAPPAAAPPAPAVSTAAPPAAVAARPAAPRTSAAVVAPRATVPGAPPPTGLDKLNTLRE